MKISYNWLKEYTDINKTPKKLADILTMHSFEVEGIEKIKNDYILDIDVLPNRSHDCLSHLGVAREVSALLGTKVKFNPPKVKESKKYKTEDFISVSVKDKKRCPRYTARVILNVKIKESPKWLKDRLEALGQNSINNVVDITNYVMFLLGQPMHAFDLDKIKDGRIIVDRAGEGEKITTLGGENYILDDSILTIRGKEGALAIAGIKGGTLAEIDNNTKNIVLESAYFEPTNIRFSSKKLNLRTDSSLRFENEIHPTLSRDAIDIASALIFEVAGGDICFGVVDTAKDKKYQKTVIPFSVDQIQDILGVNVSQKDILSILKKLRFSVKKSSKKDIFLAEVPYDRLDISQKEDLAEEVVRVYGYENIISKPMIGELFPAKVNEEYLYENKIKDMFVGLGFSEAYNYSFIGKKEVELFGGKYPNLVSLLNPLSEDKKYLRPNLIFNLLNNVFENLKHHKHIRLFEIGKVFSLKKDNVNENIMLSGVLAEKTKEKERDGGEAFFELKGILETFFSRIGIADVWFSDSINFKNDYYSQFWHSKRVASINISNKNIGTFGEVSHFLLDKMEIKGRVVIFDIDFKALLNEIQEEFMYQQISKFPAVVRDISVLVESHIKVIDVMNVIENFGGKDLFDVDLFDIYEEENSDGLSKSFAFHLIFQSKERTLSDKEVNELMEKIIKAIKERGWEIKGE